MTPTAPADRAGTPPLLWQPTVADREGSRIGEFLRWLERERGLVFAGYDDLWRWSVDELAGFWDAVWHFFAVPSSAPYTSVLSSRVMPGARWFEGSRLNYAEALLAGASSAGASEDRAALIAVDEEGPPREMSWAELRGQVGALAAALRDLGVGPGDRVAAYLPNIPEAVVGFLATPASERCGRRAHRISGCAAWSTAWARWSPGCSSPSTAIAGAAVSTTGGRSSRSCGPRCPPSAP